MLPVTSKNEVRSSVEEKDEVRDRTIRGEYRIPRSSLPKEATVTEEYRKKTRQYRTVTRSVREEVYRSNVKEESVRRSVGYLPYRKYKDTVRGDPRKGA
jgi:hypothetical protein